MRQLRLDNATERLVAQSGGRTKLTVARVSIAEKWIEDSKFVAFAFLGIDDDMESRYMRRRSSQSGKDDEGPFIDGQNPRRDGSLKETAARADTRKEVCRSLPILNLY